MMKVSRNIVMVVAITIVGAMALLPVLASAHCQVPCGIYDDYSRVEAMLEDAVTVEKAMRKINDLAGSRDAQSQNQLVRWVMNKETHAQKIIATISDYFLTQRVKPKQNDYEERLAKHHAVILSAMKAKQSADEKFAVDLRHTIEALLSYYQEKKY